MQRTSDANTESIVKIKTKDIMLEQQIQEDIMAAMKAKDISHPKGAVVMLANLLLEIPSPIKECI